jgi:hypothetical protein
MSINNPSPDKLSRRRALRMLGLTAVVGYSVPMAMMVSNSAAKAEERTVRIHRTRRRTDRRFFHRRRRSDRHDHD